MKFNPNTLSEIARMVCGDYFNDFGDHYGFFMPRNSDRLAKFFKYCGIDYQSDDTTNEQRVEEILDKILQQSCPKGSTSPDLFVQVIKTLMVSADACNEEGDRSQALAILNKSLSREGFEACMDLPAMQ
jgi:hypothetical protein